MSASTSNTPKTDWLNRPVFNDEVEATIKPNDTEYKRTLDKLNNGATPKRGKGRPKGSKNKTKAPTPAPELTDEQKQAMVQATPQPTDTLQNVKA